MNSQDEQPTWRLRTPEPAPDADLETLQLGDSPGVSQSWTAVPLVKDAPAHQPAGSSPDVATVDVTSTPTSPCATAPLTEPGLEVPTEVEPAPEPVATATAPDPRIPMKALTTRLERTEAEPARQTATAPAGNSQPSAGGPAAMIRFGPGVPDPKTSEIAAVWHATPAPAPPRRRRTAGYLVGVLVVLAVIGILLWQRLGPSLAVRSVTVAAPSGTLTCGGTEDVVATVHTNGRAGTLRYRWHRSDDTDSGPQSQHVAAGPATLRLPLRWTFQGHGSFHATALLEVISPDPETASVSFTYTCR